MEKLNDVLGYDLKIYQNDEWFCFSLDSVLLANFPKIKSKTKKILDLGTGNAVIPLVLSLRTKASIYGVDIQSDIIEMANKSIEYNNLQSQVKLEACDMKSLLLRKNEYNTYDLILSNPPYFNNLELSTKNDDIHKTIARHEVMIKLSDIINVASKLLKEGGTFALIHRTDRLVEIINCMQEYNIEPKLIKFVYKNMNSCSEMFYIEGIKNGSKGLKIAKPFVLYEVDRTKTFDYEQLCKEVYL